MYITIHMPKKEFSLYLDSKIVYDFDQEIFPYRRSNVLTNLILKFLEENNGKRWKNAIPRDSKLPPMTRKGEI
jgi:hypothetical protein